VSSPRTFSDVENEIANTMAQLPHHSALVSVIENGRSAMYTIATEAPFEIGDEDEARVRAERIRNTSRERYGRDGNAVKATLRQRLRARSVTDEAEEPRQSRQQPPFVPPQQVMHEEAIVDDEEGIILRD
jgi:hypothetical protein